MYSAVKLKKFIFLCFITIFILACSCDTKKDLSNSIPTIKIFCDSTEVMINGSLNFSSNANDSDGDSLTVTWTATGGAFDKAIGANVKWTAPAIEGNYVIKGTVI